MSANRKPLLSTLITLLSGNSRSYQAGNVIALLAAITLCLIIALVFFTLNYTRLLGGGREQATAIEAAALAAASDLARIVINDPYYGYIAVSDYPPVGKATKAPDGQSLPVLGINTVIATARLDMLVAGALGDATMTSLAKQDASHAKQAAERLTQALEDSLVAGGGGAVDMDNNPVQPFDDAQAVYESNAVKMSQNSEGAPSAFTLSIGYLDNGSSTTTATPQPDSMANVPSSSQDNGKYKAFVDIPAGGKDFWFVGVGDQATLVENSHFVQNDGSRPCSVVKVEADQSFNQINSDGTSTPRTVHAVACAQPFANVDHVTPGTITISFPSGMVPGIVAPGSLLPGARLMTNPSQLFSPPNGDWPADPSLIPASVTGLPPVPTTGQSWAAGLYHWVRNSRTKPRIDDLQKMQTTTFDSLGFAGTSGPVSLNLPGANGFIPKAYARHGAPDCVATGLLCSTASNNDPRLLHFNSGDVAAQQAYLGMETYSDVTSQLPPNTFMIAQTPPTGTVVSADCNCSHPLDLPTIHEFWTRILESNTSGLIAIAVGNAMAVQAAGTIDRLSQDIATANLAIDTLNRQLQTDSSLTNDQRANIQNNIQSQSNAVQGQIDALNSARSSLTAAQNCAANGTAVATATDLIIKNQRYLSSHGFFRSGSGFSIGNSLFTPQPVAPTLKADPSTGLLAFNSLSTGPSGANWTDSGLNCYTMPTIATARPASNDFLQTARAASVIPADGNMFLYELTDDGHITISVLPLNPYQDVPVSQNQILGISFNAITTGTTLPVTWTATIRDQTTLIGPRGGKHRGQPIDGATTPFNWCQDPSFGPNRHPLPVTLPIDTTSTSDAAIPGVKGRFMKRSLGTKPQAQDNFFMLPAYAHHPQAPVTNVTAPGPRKLRATYVCGGQATDFQVRSPVVANAGFASAAARVLSAPRLSDWLGSPFSGAAKVDISSWHLPPLAGVPRTELPIPNTSGWLITPQPGPIPLTAGPPALPGTMPPGGTISTPLCPPAPSDLL